MKQEQITLRCEDGAEAVVFTKYTHHILDIDYEICVQDDYTGGDYKGFLGRIRRAWRAFWDKPVVYTGIYCKDETKMKYFLWDCLDLVDKKGLSKYADIDPYYLEHRKDELDDSVTSNEELIKRENGNANT